MASIDYQLVRSSRRKTISLQVKHGQVRVLAPEFVNEQYIAELVVKKRAWLQQKIALQQQSSETVERQYQHDEVFYYLGKPYRLSVVVASKNSVSIEAEHIVVAVKVANDDPALIANAVKKQLHAWYKQQAMSILLARSEQWQQDTKLKAKCSTVRYFKSRWGSCDSKGHVKLNWLLVMAPDWVIDYVIIHELCHLKHMNHSAEFWALVSSFYGNHKVAKTWLTQHQSHLYWIN
ncbi:M48 family peptidase [Thalassotalea sp. HSM 43]|uniref:M48 family metallopeptidase n=1 Tax=Thalassotalea sp. HSM 43 TaxID=2552945 RepID=UPI00108106FD|nr:SprT family zinc-dependent metalloprotease [Thalassotalea sp. HSM 43]QBY03793.1 M48 family peptidase [Thalassotalea sp. HSM 43]